MAYKFLKQKLITRLTIASIVLVLMCLLIKSDSVYADTREQKNVLIINSYHQGLKWSNDQTHGIMDTFHKSGNNLATFIEYMDWKNYPNQDNLQRFTDSMKYKYQNKNIDLVMATDDLALEFVLKNRETLFSNAPVVFCGVNLKGAFQITGQYKGFTGVLEEVDPTDTINMALSINPSLKDVYILFDNSESGVSTGQIVVENIQSMNKNLNTIPLNNLTYDQLIESVRNYDKDSIILVATYYSDANGKIIEFEHVSREVSANSSVPVYHLYDMGLNNGAFGGIMLSGQLQGESAANLAIRILDGANPDRIPVLSPMTTRKVFDFNQLQRFNISLNEIPSDSEVINKPFSFFETYKTLVLSVLVVFLMLIAFVAILLYYLLKIRKMKKGLSESHEELTQIYEELAASEEELRQQFDELSSVQGRLSKSEERFRNAAEGSNAIIWDVDISTMHYHFSDRWYELLGYEKDEIDESNGGWRTIIHPEEAIAADKARNLHLEGKTEFYNTEYRVKMKNGQYKWFNVRGKVLKEENGKNSRFAGSMIDITERKEYERKLQESYQELESTYEELTVAQEELKQQYDQIVDNHRTIKMAEERLTYLAYNDTLTGLPNKLSLYGDSYKRYFLPQNEKAALLFIDMDHFKYINDTMGHAFGDQLIIEVSRRLTRLLEDSCSIYRLSGDEIIIIVQNVKGKEDIEVFATRIFADFVEKFDVLKSVLHISLSMGIAMYPEHGKTIEELLKNADIAMYKAKEMGRKRYVVYDQLMDEVFTERATIEKHLHSALENNEFLLHYQPQVDIASNKITGFEALLRWKSPELGMISPLKFIKVAEDTHIIIPLGTWVLRTACAFLKKLNEMGYKDLSMSVNISMLQLLQTDFSDVIRDTLKTFELRPQCLELEITETLLMESFEAIGLKLEKLSELGVRIALDDFGKGYSSLSYLKQLPISTLKIDKSFIDNTADTSDNNSLTGHIVTLGKSLGMCVVAEGVERQEQLDYLVEHKCHKIQGYLFSKPIPEAEIITLLSEEAEKRERNNV